MTQSKKTKTAAPEKDKKPKLVRDSFTIPKNEYAVIDALKARALTVGLAIKKSELLRAGLMQLDGLDDAALKAALGAVPTLKTGRPSGSKPEGVEAVETVEAGADEVAPAVAPEAGAPATAPVRVVAASKRRKPKAAPATQATATGD